jgi:hypothetical protein
MNGPSGLTHSVEAPAGKDGSASWDDPFGWNVPASEPPADLPGFWRDQESAGPPRSQLLNEHTTAVPYLPVIDEPEPVDRTRLILACAAGLVLMLTGWLLVSVLTGGSTGSSGQGTTASSTNDVAADSGGNNSATPPAAAALVPLGPSGGSDELGLNDPGEGLPVVSSSTTDTAPTTTQETTTTTQWTEPTIPPMSEWVDAGHGVLVPDVLLRIRFCESTNNYDARNSGSSARGAYQFLRKSWEWYGHAARTGVAEAHLATPAQQDAAALRTLQQDGTRPWLASRDCWSDPNIDSRYATAGPKPTTPAQTTTSTSTPDESSTTVTTLSPGSTETTTPESTTITSSTTESTSTTSTTDPQESTSTTGSTTTSTSTPSSETTAAPTSTTASTTETTEDPAGTD